MLDGRDVYLEEGSAVIDAYVKYATDIAVALGATAEAASEQMKDMVDFEIQLAKVMKWRACSDPDGILLENQTAIGFLSNTGPDPLENVTSRYIYHTSTALR